MWVYQLLDVTGTLIEAVLQYAMVRGYCSGEKKRLFYLIPAMIYFASIYFWTWLIVDGTFKVFALALLSFAAYKLITRESSGRLLAGIMTQIICARAAEALSILIVSAALGDITVRIDGMQFLRPSAYLLYFLFQLVWGFLIWYFLKKYHNGVDKRSLAAISVCFFFVILLGYSTNLPFLAGEADWENPSIELFVVVLAILFVILLVYIKNYLFLKEQARQDQMQIARLQQQHAYYQEKQKDEERIRSIYHDMKNHLLVLEGCEQNEAARKMAGKLREEIAAYEDYVHTGNDFLDVILRDKAAKARQRHIDFSIGIEPGSVDFLKPLDLSTIFGNGLDNAIEASEKLPGEQRVILVKAGRVRDFLSILIENRYAGEEIGKGSPFAKKDSFLHGFGLSNMEKAAGKYQGVMTAKGENGTFTLKILIPVP